MRITLNTDTRAPGTLGHVRTTIITARGHRIGRLASLALCLLLAIPSSPRHEVAPTSVSTAVSMETLLAPTSASIAGAIDAAATETLPAGYPAPRGAMHVPPVLLKAIAWVESSWRQFDASRRPLTSRGGGVGIMQLTRGLGGEAADPVVRSAIADNYVYNIASGARLLAAKWAATPRVGDGDPMALEDWYYAVWAYNDWGWRNNPRNPVYTRVDTPATHPETFP